MTNRATRRALAATAALLATTTLAACGDDSEAAGSGDTIKVMVYGPFDAKGFSLPDISVGAQAGVDKVNEDGGIGGRELELITCNDNNDPNTAAGCARKAVQEGVVATVGGFSTFEPQIIPVLEKAGIPMVGVTAVSTFNASNMYPIATGAPGGLFATGKYLATDPACEGRVQGLIEDFAATQGAIKLPELAVSIAGGTWTGVSTAPQGATDFAPAVAAAVDKASCLVHLSGPQTSPVIIKAIADNGKVKAFGASESTVPSSVIEALGDAADGQVLYSAYLPLNDTTDTPEMKDFLERGRKLREEFSPDQSAASAYLASLVLQKALDGVDTADLSAADVTDALAKFSGYDTGLGPIVDFTAKNPTKAFSALPYATPVYRWVAEKGQYVLADPEPLSITDIYDAASAAGQ